MRKLLFVVGFALLTSCVSQKPPEAASLPPAVGPWMYDGYVYDYTFDEKDGELISDLETSFSGDCHIYWLAPHGPVPVKDSSYAKNLSFLDLREDLPMLRLDTFKSFLRRNNPIPAHNLSQWRSRDGRIIHVDTDASASLKTDVLSRGGFSSDGSQAIIYGEGGGTIYLFERRNKRWRFIKSSVLWAS